MEKRRMTCFMGRWGDIGNRWGFRQVGFGGFRGGTGNGGGPGTRLGGPVTSNNFLTVGMDIGYRHWSHYFLS